MKKIKIQNRKNKEYIVNININKHAIKKKKIREFLNNIFKSKSIWLKIK